MSVWHYCTSTIYRLLDVDPSDPSKGQAYLPWKVSITYYVEIPNGNNRAGVSYRVAAREEKYSQELGKVPHSVIDLDAKNPTVYNALQIGAVYEFAETFEFSSCYLSDSQRDAQIDARCGQIETEIVEKKQREWRYWGYAQTI